MNKVANFLLDWSKKKEKNSSPFRYKDIKNVLVLSDNPLPPTFINNFPEVHFLFYSKTNDIPKGYQEITDKDLNFLGKIKDENIKDALEKNYDLFIDFHTENNAFLQYLYRRVNANCKISYKDEKWVDIKVQKENPNSYLENIIKVIQKF